MQVARESGSPSVEEPTAAKQQHQHNYDEQSSRVHCHSCVFRELRFTRSDAVEACRSTS